MSFKLVYVKNNTRRPLTFFAPNGTAVKIAGKAVKRFVLAYGNSEKLLHWRRRRLIRVSRTLIT